MLQQSQTKNYLVFSHRGDQLMVFSIKNPVTLATDDKTLAIFCHNEILVIENIFECKRIPLHHKVNFCAVENGQIYFISNNTLYYVINGLFMRTITVKNHPLCINKRHLLSCNNKLFPSPNIEYHKITLGNEISNAVFEDNIRGKLQDLMLMYERSGDFNSANVVKRLCGMEIDIYHNEKIFIPEIPHFRNDPTLLKNTENKQIAEKMEIEETLLGIINQNSQDEPKVETKTKRFNPFAKKNK
ncbi:hypothetical protein EDEG_02615 [Edhazardia aedis USNM 41457]|uniref:Uncharacterized protein n=1 Tax=Edhazardia aedis (strain USNM 41457) TaxID=1003232 RepID=J9D591_EDHAE|nr:hypothetical protein EDEG_02615 [Edhazardia aedis USNM 41457]|eukprot:EJW02971.1 hypothetical protein EDEG_02615 [Edhazardia aedis USNM 41457]